MSSFPKGRVVRGYSVPRLRLGKMLESLVLLGDLPADLLAAAFPGKSLDGALSACLRAGPEEVRALVTGALAHAPGVLVRLVSSLLEIPESQLLEDEALGLVGLLELLEALAEVNEWGNFWLPARRLWRLLAATGRM